MSRIACRRQGRVRGEIASPNFFASPGVIGREVQGGRKKAQRVRGRPGFRPRAWRCSGGHAAVASLVSSERSASARAPVCHPERSASARPPLRHPERSASTREVEGPFGRAQRLAPSPAEGKDLARAWRCSGGHAMAASLVSSERSASARPPSVILSGARPRAKSKDLARASARRYPSGAAAARQVGRRSSRTTCGRQGWSAQPATRPTRQERDKSPPHRGTVCNKTHRHSRPSLLSRTESCGNVERLLSLAAWQRY